MVEMALLCKIVPERCIACGLCQLAAPQIFDYDEEGIVLFAQEPEAHQQFVKEADESNVKKAYQKCPVRAILLEEQS
jgi:ferredoxin